MSLKINLLFYRATSIVGKMIELMLGEKIVHVCALLETDNERWILDVSHRGVELKRQLPYNPESIAWKVCVDNTNIRVSYLLANIGKKYDWLGALRFIFPWVKPNDDRFFCSELFCKAMDLPPMTPYELGTYLIFHVNNPDHTKLTHLMRERGLLGNDDNA